MSYSDKYTDKAVIQLERRLAKLYASVYDEITEEAQSYFNEFEKKYNNEYQAYLDGKYTKQEFDNWVNAQIGRGKRWVALRNEMAAKVTNANVVASSFINGKIPDVFMTNYNYSAYEIEQASGIAFNIYNESAVRELMANEPELLPATHINIPKDQRWNQKRLSAALASGIIQGKPLNKLADSFQQVTSMNRTSAIRNARTAMTGAQNAGRQKNMEDVAEFARSKGMDIKKEWISCGDSRVRDSHAHLDGVRIDVEDIWPNGLKFPGDPDGAPAEVYNCRCIQRTVINGIHAERNTNTKESYEKWQKERLAEQEAKRNGNSIAKAITVDDIVSATRSSEISEEVTNEIATIMKQKRMLSLFDDVQVVNIISEKDRNAVFRTNVSQYGTFAKYTLELNQNKLGGMSVEDVNSMFRLAKNTVCDSLEDALEHEKYHAKLCNVVGYHTFDRMAHTEGLKGISQYAESDQTETISEIAVLKDKGAYDTIDKKAKAFFEEFFPEG